MVAKEATFIISLATEEFIKQLAYAAQRIAEREKRATVQHKDTSESHPSSTAAFYLYSSATVIRRTDRFMFLQGMVWEGF